MMNTTREILASLNRDDVEFSISLKFPPNYPLKSIEVTNLKSGVFSEFEIKTWSISMSRLISSQNCDLLGALMLWKANYDKKFEGVEPCPICYSIVHEDTYSIPSLQCKTCKNKFHAACLKKWFRTSHKNKCPFCQNYFF